MRLEGEDKGRRRRDGDDYDGYEAERKKREKQRSGEGRQIREEESMKKVRQKDERIWAKGR